MKTNYLLFLYFSLLIFLLIFLLIEIGKKWKQKIELYKKGSRVSVHSTFVLRDVIFFLENWIKYHKHIGVTKFYLYDNSQTGSRRNRVAGSDSEGENKYGISTGKLFPYSEKNKEELRRICEKYPEITIVPWNPRGGDGKIIYAQHESVRDYNKKYADPNGWTAYIDIDEYITSDSLSGENFLKKILRRALIDGCSKISIKQKKFEDLFCQLEKPFISIDNCLELDFDLLAHKNIVLNTTFKNLSNIHEISTKYGKQYIPEMSELRFNHYNLNKACGKWIEDFFKKQNIISFKSKDNSLKAMESLNFSLPTHLLDKDFYQKHTGKNYLFQE